MDYDLGTSYRFPLGFYAGADFYYGYQARPHYVPWWIHQGYDLRYRTWNNNTPAPLSDAIQQRLDEAILQSERLPGADEYLQPADVRLPPLPGGE